MEKFQKQLSITMGEEKSCNSIGSAVHESDVVQAVVRKTPPADYTLKIDSFAFLLEMLEKTKAKSYSSRIFEASGYDWKLHLYPRGDEKRNGEGYISFYVSIQRNATLPLGWQINANIKFFVYDQIRDEYLVFQDVSGEAIRFHEMKKEWGTAQLLDLKIFHDATNGFLLHDKCAFGVEILAKRYSGRGECLSLPVNIFSTYTWKVVKCSKTGNVIYSDVFVMGNLKWKIMLYPNGGQNQEGKNISLFLASAIEDTNFRIFAEYKLCIKNQKNDKDLERTTNHLFTHTKKDWGWSAFHPLIDIKDPFKGYLLKDTLIVQVEITRISTAKDFSSK
ncbi:uncharacterized protein LOC113781679 [Coffea eugenioides]|uniref:uncharacterized protein LOC113781554 n=1 Tax=Coffea eugenioides TaxID=49369 RepID=UPI000F60D906|nr:uncharacterized protein LOC113781554 [Coffea eugenioides]XP_027183452.1 uncharacterized protein LOC113781679 [Coffea eugenioides]